MRFLLLGFLSCFLFAACSDPGARDAPYTIADSTLAAGEANDLITTAVDAESFSMFIAAAEAADLLDTLRSAGPFTLFAPTDDAFAALPEGTLDDLLDPQNRDALTMLLHYHIVPDRIPSTDLAAFTSLPTFHGDSLAVLGSQIGSANVVLPDVEASNGIIHGIDQVLRPK